MLGNFDYKMLQVTSNLFTSLEQKNSQNGLNSHLGGGCNKDGKLHYFKNKSILRENIFPCLNVDFNPGNPKSFKFSNEQN